MFSKPPPPSGDFSRASLSHTLKNAPGIRFPFKPVFGTSALKDLGSWWKCEV